MAIVRIICLKSSGRVVGAADQRKTEKSISSVVVRGVERTDVNGEILHFGQKKFSFQCYLSNKYF